VAPHGEDTTMYLGLRSLNSAEKNFEDTAMAHTETDTSRQATGKAVNYIGNMA
jgi:hypothetical protein